MRMVLMGPPGAGKGTQAALLCVRRGLAHVSTGEMLRRSAEAGHPLGVEAKALIDRGLFVPDAVALGIVAERLAEPDAASGFVLDGFPRTPAQAEALDALLEGRGLELDRAVELRVDEAALLRRVESRAGAARARGETPRADDTAEALAVRMERYHALTAPVLAFYRASGRLVAVDGMLPPEAVAGLLDAVLDVPARAA